MAIQLRRGAYANFDPAKMLPAEVGVVTSGDPGTADGKAAYVAFAAGNVKKLATVDDIATEIDGAVDEAVQRAEDVAESIEASAEQIETNRTDIADLRADFDEFVPGLSDNAKAALLACFRHVAWTDQDSQTYYDALETALYEGEIVLERISATYTSSGQKIYPWDTLDDLRPYISVVATYSDGTSESVSNYTLSGSLETAQSTITVSYLNKTDQITIDVTIDSALMYYVPKGTVLDGQTSGFDTGIKLTDTNKAFSFVADFTDLEVLSRVRSLAFASDRNVTSSTTRFYVGLLSSQSDDAFLKRYFVQLGSQTSVKSDNLANGAHHIRLAVIHSAGASNYKLFLSIDGTTVFNFITSTTYWEDNDQTVFIGKWPTGGYMWNGVINLCSVFSRVLTDVEAEELLGVA